MTPKVGAGLVLALGSAAALNWGFFAQHGAAAELPPLTVCRPLRSLQLLFTNGRWLQGFVVGIAGWCLYIVALALAPLSVVQAASAGGIGLLALLVERGGRVRLARREWAGVGIALAGLVLLGLSLGGRTGPGSRRSWEAIALWVGASAAASGLFARPLSRLLAPGAGLGVASGLLYPAGDVATKAATAGGAMLWFVPVLLACHGLGFVSLQMGFQRGEALPTAGISTLFTNALPIAAGIALFREPVPGGFLGVLRVAAFVSVIGGGDAAGPDGGAEPGADGLRLHGSSSARNRTMAHLMDAMQVGLLGCGNVGAAVARMLHEHAGDIARRAGVRIEVARVAVRDASRRRSVPVPPDVFTDDPFDVVRDPNMDVVVEVIGGTEPAGRLILEALSLGKPVVTANKELLATRPRELFRAARAGGVDLLYEAAVGGGIPIIRPLRQSLAGDRILRFMGIVNGTTNYILTRMTEDGMTATEALQEAQRFGFAERDPGADLEGHDAAAKAAILATIAFDLPVVASDVYREGITGVTVDDIAFAGRLGYVVKLLAIAEALDGDVSVRVHPAMIPKEHPLASVRESFNAIFIEGERVGPLMFYGRGAGGDPTATSIVGDLVELARNRGARVGTSGIGHAAHSADELFTTGRRVTPIEDLTSQYYILMRVADRPGVLAAIATAFARHQVSIKSVWQEGREAEAQIVLITHRASERSLRLCVEDLRAIDTVTEVSSVIRVEAGEP